MDSKTTASGLKITTLAAGKGAEAKNGDKVSVNYTGSLTDGKVFDSNVDPKFGHVEPFAFVLGSHQVIAGWDEGVLGMKVGEKRRLVIPASLGYGDRGAGSVIPPNATLSFDVEVTAIAAAK
jgi:FKBP-type peptidyl-prolyl cis-trans isomerase